MDKKNNKKETKMLKKVNSFAKSNVWLVVIGVAVLVAGGISQFITRTKQLVQKPVDMVKGA